MARLSKKIAYGVLVRSSVQLARQRPDKLVKTNFTNRPGELDTANLTTKQKEV